MIFTIGHSTMSSEDFINLMGTDVPILVDVRSHPGSKAHPQFNKESMEVWLAEGGKRYIWQPRLGGWDTRHADLVSDMAAHGVDLTPYVKGHFPKQRIAAKRDPLSEKPEWTSVGLRDYTYFETLEEFRRGVLSLIQLSELQNVAICCCEACWFKCHRSLISDFLWFNGIESYHIMGKRRIAHSSVIGNRLERYDAYVMETWKRWKHEAHYNPNI